jgi:putative DNA methylase
MIQTLNFRLADSLPASVIAKWKNELSRESHVPGSAAVPAASWAQNRDVELRRHIEKYLDAGHGECRLRRPDIAGLAESALLHFDGERYRLLAWCVMPNHVHALIETQKGFTLANVIHSWKSFISHKANQILRLRGEFWQREYLDRYVRNSEHYEKVVAYIEENPVKAGLAKVKTDWQWSSAKFRTPGSAAVPAAS